MTHRSHFGVSVFLGLALAAALAADGVQDQITLKDGRIVTGTIVEESPAEVTLRTSGALRHYQRDFIRGIHYGGGGSDTDAASAALPPPTAAAANPLDLDLSRRYSVPVTEVQWVRRQGVADADLPMVFFIAAKASVLPGVVVDLRLKGWAWPDIERHFGLEPRRVYFVPGPVVPYPLLRASILWPFWLLQILTHARR